jgi:hypothetical protein
MQVSQRGETTIVQVANRAFKVTYSTRFRRMQIREGGRLLREAATFQEALTIIDNMTIAS